MTRKIICKTCRGGGTTRCSWCAGLGQVARCPEKCSTEAQGSPKLGEGDCRRCDGLVWLTLDDPALCGELKSVADCYRCHGRKTEPCPRCDGRGAVSEAL